MACPQQQPWPTTSSPQQHPDLAQVVGEPQTHAEAARAAGKLRNEYVVSIKGKLRLRKDPNPKLPTGLLELLAEDIQVWPHGRLGHVGLRVAGVDG